MTSTNGERLNRIESDLETAKNILLAVARRAEATDNRVDRLVESQDRTQRQLDQLSVKVDQLTENTDRAITGINATLTSINAAIERQDRILDYLIRRDVDGDQPPR